MEDQNKMPINRTVRNGSRKLKVKSFWVNKESREWKLEYLEDVEPLIGSYERVGGAYRVHIKCDNNVMSDYLRVDSFIEYYIFQALKMTDDEIKFLWEINHFETHPKKIFKALHINHTCPTCHSNFHISEVDIDDTGECHFCRNEEERPLYRTWEEMESDKQSAKSTEKRVKKMRPSSRSFDSSSPDLNEDFRHMDIDGFEDYLGSL